MHQPPAVWIAEAMVVIGVAFFALVIARRIILPAPARRTESSETPLPGRIAVLIATHNGMATLAETLRSATGQADVYVVSDGSTDATADVARANGAEVLELTTNVGKPSALKEAVDVFGLTSRYDAVAILDDDTLISSDFIEVTRRALTPGVVIAVGKTITRWDDDHRWNVWLGCRAYAYWRYQATLRRGQSSINVMNCISGSNSVYRSALLDQVLVANTPYIVDDTYWVLEVQRRRLGKIVYVAGAKAWICDPTTLKDWYKQNLRWMWGSFQGIWGHKVGRRASVFDLAYGLQILDWILYVVIAPVLLVVVLTSHLFDLRQIAAVALAGYLLSIGVGAFALRRWRLAVMTPALVVVDWIYRFVFLHALVKTIRQPRVASCRWESPARY